MDRALKVDLRKKVRGIKTVEQNSRFKTDRKSQLILRIVALLGLHCRMMDAILLSLAALGFTAG
jgi:hypothetical protein